MTAATSAASVDSVIKDQLKATSAQELIRTTTATVTSKRQQLKLDIKTAAAVQQLLKKKGSTSSLVRLPDSPSARSVFPLKKRPLINSDLVIDDKSSILQPVKKESSSQDLLQHTKGKSTYYYNVYLVHSFHFGPGRYLYIVEKLTLEGLAVNRNFATK